MIKVEAIELWRDKNLVLSNFSANFPNNQVTLIKGANGSGKTSLLKAISGELKINSGSITYEGTNIYQMSAKTQTGFRSVMMQQASFLFNYHVGELLDLVKVYGELNPQSKKIETALEIDRTSSFSTLSIGQQQRVILAIALSMNSSFYLLDEPISAQDEPHARAIAELIADLSECHGFLIVDHGVSALGNRFSNICSVE